MTQAIWANTKYVERLTRSFIDTSSKVLLVLTDGKIMHANPPAIKALGYSYNELQGLPYESLLIAPSDKLNRNLLNRILIAKNQKTQIEVTVHSKEGSILWYTVNATRCTWKQKPSLLLALEDSEFLHDEVDTPRLLENNYMAALRATKHSVWSYNFSSGESFVSKELFEALGFKTSSYEPTIDSWRQLLHPTSLEEFQKFIHNINETRDFPEFWEYRVRNSSGAYQWFACITKVTDWDITGCPIKVLGVHMDIGDRKKKAMDAENRLHFFNGLVQSSQDGLVFFDQKGVILEWNSSMERITEIRREQAVGKYIGSIGVFVSSQVTPSDFQKVSIKEILNSNIFSGVNPFEGKVLESCVQRNSGEVRIIHKYLSVIQNPHGMRFALTIKDVTSEQLNLQKFEKHEERLNLAMVAGKLGVWDIDLVSGENYFSPMVFNILGYLPWEVEPTVPLLKSLIHPDDLQHYEQTIQPFLISGTSIALEIRLQKKSGDYAWILSKNHLYRDVYGKTLRIVGTITDISNQKNTELELLRSQEGLQRNICQHEVLSEISYLFGTNQTMHSKCERVLTILGQFTNASRVYIFENDWESMITANTYEWNNEGIESQKQKLQNESLALVEEWLAGKGFLISNDIENDFPAELAQLLIGQDIQSFLFIPIEADDYVFGYIGFDECTRRRVWEKAEIELLKTIANIISFAFEREKRLNYFRQNEQTYREFSNRMAEVALELSENGDITFINQSGKKLIQAEGMELKGLSFWNFISASDKKLLQRAFQSSAHIQEPVEIIVKLANGESRKFLFSITRKIMENGSVSHSLLAAVSDNR